MNVHEDALQEAIAAAALVDAPVEQVELDVSNSTDDLNSASEELGAMSRQVDTAGGMVESLESFMDGFMSRVPEGEWTPAIARQYRVGIGAVLAAHGINADMDKVSASFESAGVSQTNDENRAENKEKTQGLIRRLYEALKAAVIALGKAIKNFVMGVDHSAETLQKTGESLKNQLTTLHKDIPTGAFSGKPGWGIYYQMKDGPATSGARVLDAVGNELNTLLGHWDKSFMSQVKAPGSLLDSAEGAAVKIKVSGGIVIEATHVNAELTGAGKSLAEATIKVTKGEYPTNGIPFMSKDEIGQVAKAIIDNAAHMKTMADHSKPILAAVEGLVKKFEGADVKVADRIEFARKLVAKYPEALRVLVPQVSVVSMNAYKHAKASMAKATGILGMKGKPGAAPKADEGKA